MKKNSTAKQFFQIGLSTVINMVIGVLTTPIITRLVLPEDYGKFALFNTYSSIIMIVLCLGLDQALVRYFYRKEEENYRICLFRKLLLIPLPALIIASVVIFVVFAINGKVFSIDDTAIVILFIVNLFVCAFNRFSFLLLRLRYHTGWYSIINIIHKASYVLLVIFGALVFKEGFLLILVASTVISAIIMQIMSVIAEKEYYITKTEKVSIDLSLKTLVKYSFPLMISSCVFTAFQAIDRLSIEQLMTYTDVGIYSSAQNLMSVFAIIQTTFNTIWSPKAIEHYEQKPDDTNFYKNVHQLMVVIMFVFGTTVLVSKDIIVLLLGEKYREAAYVIPFLMFNPIMYTISETTVNGLYFKEKSYWHIIITFASCLVNIFLNNMLIPIYGIKGAAISTGISYIVFFELRTLLSNKYYYIKYGLLRLHVVLCAAVVFAWKCMFFRTDFVTIIMYVVFLAIIAVLYKNQLLRIKEYIRIYVRGKILKKGGNTDD